MTNKKRLAALILAVLVLLALMTSLFVIIHEADHDCTGEDCPICAVIAVCRNTLKLLGDALAALAVVFACFCFAASSAILYFFEKTNQETPVSLKVKLLN